MKYWPTRSKPVIATIAALCLPLLGGCMDDKPKSSASGESLFNHYCANCHQQSGTGSFLEGVPANRDTKLTQQEVVNLVLYGREDKPGMPQFRDQLTPTQAKKVAEHLLETLKQ